MKGLHSVLFEGAVLKSSGAKPSWGRCRDAVEVDPKIKDVRANNYPLRVSNTFSSLARSKPITTSPPTTVTGVVM